MDMEVLIVQVFFFFKQKTAYEMRISDWSSDVCSSDLGAGTDRGPGAYARHAGDGPAWSLCRDDASPRGHGASLWARRLQGRRPPCPHAVPRAHERYGERLPPSRSGKGIRRAAQPPLWRECHGDGPRGG